jgi:hypothetical protein
VASHVQIGTQMLGRAEAVAGAGPGAAGTLLAVVPIPGTGTSLAIVGYPVPAPGGELGGTTMTAPAGTLLGDAVLAGALPAGTLSAGTLPPGTLLPGLLAANPAPAVLALPGQAADGYPGLQIDADQRRVCTEGTEVPLTFQEFELLAFLAAHPGTVFSRADLVREVWQRDFAADSRTVDVHVSRLRHKLGPAYGRCLVTEYRIGYQFRPLDSRPLAKTAILSGPDPALSRGDDPPYPPMCARAHKSCGGDSVSRTDQPLTFGPALVAVTRSRTRCSRSMAAR